MEWIIIIILLLFIFGRTQHGKIGYSVSTAVPSTVGASSGDSFVGNVNTVAPGIAEPTQIPSGTTISTSISGSGPFQMQPSGPPPIAIQKPTVMIAPVPVVTSRVGPTVKTASPGVSQAISPTPIAKTATPAPIAIIPPIPKIAIAPGTVPAGTTINPLYKGVNSRVYGMPKYRSY